MAGDNYKLNWILLLLAIASCVLMSSAGNGNVDEAKNEVTNEELIAQVYGGWLGGKQTYQMLRVHKDRELQVGSRTVGQLVELCEGSETRCQGAEFDRLLGLERTYARESTMSLSEYVKYCRTVELKKYCLDKIDRVADLLLESVKPDDQELLSSLLDYYRAEISLYNETGKKIAGTSADTGLGDKVQKSLVGRAYFELMQTKYKGENERDFLEKVRGALDNFLKIGNFLGVDLGGPQVNGSSLISGWKPLFEIAVTFLNTNGLYELIGNNDIGLQDLDQFIESS